MQKSFEIAAAENDETVEMNQINIILCVHFIAERNMGVMKGTVHTKEKTCW